MKFRALALCAALAACKATAPLPPEDVKFFVGDPYQAGGEWFYPREFNAYDVTGLATVIADGAKITADGERYDPDGLVAASPVLQLPAIVTVTNLVNGYSVDVRVNDRGPDQAGRVLAVSPHVARLLGFPANKVVEVQVRLNAQATAALDGALGEGPRLTAAPVAGITAQTLGPPGSGGAGAVQRLGPAAAQNDGDGAIKLSGRVMAGAPAPGPLWVQIAGFGRESDAFRQRQRLWGMNAVIVPTFGGERVLYAVNVGPYETVAEADAALQKLLALGFADPEIIVR